MKLAVTLLTVFLLSPISFANANYQRNCSIAFTSKPLGLLNSSQIKRLFSGRTITHYVYKHPVNKRPDRYQKTKRTYHSNGTFPHKVRLKQNGRWKTYNTHGRWTIHNSRICISTPYLVNGTWKMQSHGCNKVLTTGQCFFLFDGQVFEVFRP